MSLKTKYRNQDILREYLEGTSKEDLATKYDLTKRSIDRIIFAESAKKEITPETKEEIVEEKVLEEEKVYDTNKVFWNPKRLMETPATFYIAVSNRSPGKTYGFLMDMLKLYVESGYKKEGVYIRRYDEELKPSKGGGKCFDNIIKNGEIEKITNGKYNTIKYQGREWHLAKMENDEIVTDVRPFCYALSIRNQLSFKSGGYPNVRYIFTDEFIQPGDEYEPQIFADWQNLISTITRKGLVTLPNGKTRRMTKEEINEYKVCLAGNIVNTESVFLEEMGLHEVINQKPGTIATYTYSEHPDVSVRVEFIPNLIEDAPTDVFFKAFNGAASKAIIGCEWEIPSYPKKPCKFSNEDIITSFFIDYGHILMKCDIIEVDDSVFIYVTKKTTPLKYPDDELIYGQERSPKPNRRNNIYAPETDYEKKILYLISTGRVYFQGNEIGNKFYNYLKWCNER